MSNGNRVMNTALLDSQQRLIDKAQGLIDQPEQRERLSIDIHNELLDISRAALTYQRAMNERLKVVEVENKEIRDKQGKFKELPRPLVFFIDYFKPIALAIATLTGGGVGFLEWDNIIKIIEILSE